MKESSGSWTIVYAKEDLECSFWDLGATVSNPSFMGVFFLSSSVSSMTCRTATMPIVISILSHPMIGDTCDGISIPQSDTQPKDTRGDGDQRTQNQLNRVD